MRVAHGTAPHSNSCQPVVSCQGRWLMTLRQLVVEKGMQQGHVHGACARPAQRLRACSNLSEPAELTLLLPPPPPAPPHLKAPAASAAPVPPAKATEVAATPKTAAAATPRLPPQPQPRLPLGCASLRSPAPPRAAGRRRRLGAAKWRVLGGRCWCGSPERRRGGRGLESRRG